MKERYMLMEDGATVYLGSRGGEVIVIYLPKDWFRSIGDDEYCIKLVAVLPKADDHFVSIDKKGKVISVRLGTVEPG